jgi:alanyl-tRNA synthetase
VLVLVPLVGEQLVMPGVGAQVVGDVAKVCGGKGGGRPNVAQAGGKDPSKIPEAQAAAAALLAEKLSAVSA